MIGHDLAVGLHRDEIDAARSGLEGQAVVEAVGVWALRKALLLTEPGELRPRKTVVTVQATLDPRRGLWDTKEAPIRGVGVLAHLPWNPLHSQDDGIVIFCGWAPAQDLRGKWRRGQRREVHRAFLRPMLRMLQQVPHATASLAQCVGCSALVLFTPHCGARACEAAAPLP